MPQTRHGDTRNNVIDLGSRRSRPPAPPRILRIAPENDGLRVLYGSDQHRNRLVSLDVIGWALLDNGEVSALVPWLRDVMPAHALTDPLNGHCEGYWDPWNNRVLTQAPAHKQAELQAAHAYFGSAANDAAAVVQTFPDTPGTHVVLDDGDGAFRLVEVVGWQLRGDGRVLAMLDTDGTPADTPVLACNRGLHPAQEQPGFRYFFQHAAANQLKRRDPEALACLALLAGQRDTPL